MKINFYDLKREHQQINTELKKVVAEAIDSNHYILGEKLTTFEINFAQYLGVKHCIGVGNGLDALSLSLLALNIQKGDEVIVPAHTFIATWLAVSHVGAVPIPVEPDDSYNISVEKITQKITSKTKAVIPVHLYGRPVEMDQLNQLAKKHGLFVIEDAAQAHGSTFQGKKCGALGDLAAFSFYPTKSLGALGDGGAITTDSDELARKIRKLRNYGSTKKYVHEVAGVNSRLDEIQAAVLDLKLKRLDQDISNKQKLATKYFSKIDNPEVKLPLSQSADTQISWHQFVIRVNNREHFMGYMNKHGIQTHIHYPSAPHTSDVYNTQHNSVDYPLTQKLCETVVSLPLYATLTEKEINHIIEKVNLYEV